MDNSRLVNACTGLIEHSKYLWEEWQHDRLNDSHFGKNLSALSGYLKGYHEAYTEFHTALRLALEIETLEKKCAAEKVQLCGCPAIALEGLGNTNL